MTNRQRRGAAFHEASHAVVGWALDFAVVEIDITGGFGGGSTKFHPKFDLSFQDQIAICYAGLVGQELFNAPTTPLAGAGDYGKIASLLIGLPEELHEGIVAAGRRRACEILQQYRTNVERVAEALMIQQKMDGSKFIELFLEGDPASGR